jgi:hypothetical protein
MAENDFNLGDKVIAWQVGKELKYYVGIVAENEITERGYENYILIDTKENAVAPEVSVTPYITLEDSDFKLVQKANTLLYSNQLLRYIKKIVFLFNDSKKLQIAEKLLVDLQNKRFYFAKINMYVIRLCIYKFFSKIKNVILSFFDLFFSDLKFFYKSREDVSLIDNRLKILPALEAFEKVVGNSIQNDSEYKKEREFLLNQKSELQKSKNESSRGFVTFIISVLSLTLVFFQYRLTKNQTLLLQKQTELMNNQTEIQNNQLKLENEKTLPHFTVSQRYIRNEMNEVVGDGLYIEKDENYAQDTNYETFALVSTKQLVPDTSPCVYFGLFNYFSTCQSTDDYALYSSFENLELLKRSDSIIAGKYYKGKRLGSLRVENYIKIDCSDIFGIQHTYYFKSDAISTNRISENTYKMAEEIFSENNIGGIDNLEDCVLVWIKRNCNESKNYLD